MLIKDNLLLAVRLCESGVGKPSTFGLSLCISHHFSCRFSISRKTTTNVYLGVHEIHDYFHSTMEVLSLTIIRRKWQRKPASSDKHMNTWICEWEPKRANVLLSGEVWAWAVYIVESSGREQWQRAALSWVQLNTVCLDGESLSVDAVKSSVFPQPLFVCTHFMK